MNTGAPSAGPPALSLPDFTPLHYFKPLLLIFCAASLAGSSTGLSLCRTPKAV